MNEEKAPLPASVIRELPSLEELHYDVTKAYENDKFLLLVNQEPPAAWVLPHPMNANLKYITIEKIELMLTRIFQHWYVEIIGPPQQLFNSVSVHVRLFYLHPITGQWLHQDGVGAVGIQTDKGAAASNIAAIKQDAVMKALPAAESYAIKDASEKIGKLFGKDLNRKDTIAFSPSYIKEDPEIKRVRKLIGDCKTMADLIKYEKDVPPELKEVYSNKMESLLKSGREAKK